MLKFKEKLILNLLSVFIRGGRYSYFFWKNDMKGPYIAKIGKKKNHVLEKTNKN